jgi:hypothetical protein
VVSRHRSGWALQAGGDTRIFSSTERTRPVAHSGRWHTFRADDLAATLAALRTAGGELEMMGDDDPYQTDERGIADPESMLIAWFRDPDNR